ncbi:hypothetical protein KQP77_06080 [Bacteroides thetaiotaomicron]|nr:hypothetical protein [Bacteroides thetaiotaomicron]UYU82707.1 hypothetical protein KQP77_06080 [Bacteroides thetaiotaomicron]
MKLRHLVCAALLLFSIAASAQPIYRFSVKVGIDCESVDSLGGVDKVKQKIEYMFKRVNKAFNHTRQFDAVYDFEVDWEAFYIYDGISAKEVKKPHPNHDYLVIIDGYKSHPEEVGGGWCGSNILTVYHSRTHNDRFNDPFNEGAIDGIIHEFGHGRGVPDIYAMKVDADKNPIAPIACDGTRCIMNYPYGETFWSEYAVNMINLAEDKMVEIDNLVADMLPKNLAFKVMDPNGKPVRDAELTFYPVVWYSNSVSAEPVYSTKTGCDGEVSFDTQKVFPTSEEFGVKYPNAFVKIASGDMVAYAWLPLYEIENATFEGKNTHETLVSLKDTRPSNPFEFKPNRKVYYEPEVKETAARWEVSKNGVIEWNITESKLPHYDHIEMSGEQIACVLRWNIDENSTLTTERSLVFPMLRRLPNNTHASLMHRIALDVPSLISVDGLVLQNPKTESVYIDGVFGSAETYCIGKQNIGSGKETSPVPAVKLTRTIFPSVDKPYLCERYVITSIRDRALTLYIPEFTQTFKTLDSKGKDGAYIVEAKVQGSGTYVLGKGESLTFDVIFSGRKAAEPQFIADVKAEFQARRDFINKDIDGALILETPDSVINTMFRYAKIRTSESICKTAGGYMHAPGGESYYAAIWANDQAEYVNPFFPYLGYWRGNESAINSFRHFARFMNTEFNPIPSSIIAEGTDIWAGAGDRGDAAMIAYGASRFSITYADKAVAQELWPLIEWCLEYCDRKLNHAGVVMSDTDELEGRFEAGDANLCTSSLYYDALLSAASLSKELGLPSSVAKAYRSKAATLKVNIEKYYGATVSGFDTYRYYDGNDILRSWICIPLTVGIFDRAEATVDALCSPLLWEKDGLLTAQGSTTFWDRSTLYALRGIYAAGMADIATEKLKYYSKRRLLGNHVPYAIEAWPEGSQRHLAAESGLYCRIITEGMFGIRPTGFKSFDITPSMPSDWNEMALKSIRAFGKNIDVKVSRIAAGKLNVVIKVNGLVKNYKISEGAKISVKI